MKVPPSCGGLRALPVSPLQCALFLGLCSLLAGLPAPAAPSPLAWSQDEGAVWRTPWATLTVDQDGSQNRLRLRFPDNQQEIRLERPQVEQPNDSEMRLTYQVEAPGALRITVLRRLTARESGLERELVESFELMPTATLANDLEIVRPFAIGSDGPGRALSCVLPLKNGWARTLALAGQGVRAEYRLGRWITGSDTLELALPAVQVDRGDTWQAGVFTDPRFSACFKLNPGPQGMEGEVRYRYASARVPLAGTETRSFGFWLRKAPPADAAFGNSLDAFFRLMLPDVPPGPRWLQGIYMVDYDYLSDGGQGWARDVARLAEWLTPEERRHVALCFHGWYDYLGVYCYDEAVGRMKDAWVAMPNTRKVPMTKKEVRERLQKTRDLGFHVLWYFGDGPLQDSGAPGYRAAWNLVDERGQSPRASWQGPDTLGKTFIRNPAHPEVARWYQGYLAALLKDYGPAVDGFVWDETYYVRGGDIMSAPVPGYCARAMLDLIKALAAQVRAHDPEKVFLSSDDVGIFGMNDAMGYAMMAHGNYQDSWCEPAAWSYALFPNWRNTAWSCNWWSVSRFHHTRWGVEQFGVPVAISNGWEDDRGASEWTPAERDRFLGLFRQRLAKGPERVRFLTRDPNLLLQEGGFLVAQAPSDPIPEPGPGETNWALAASGSKARASSENTHNGGRYPASGVIDGSREAEGWGTGHGWASAGGSALPQWVEIAFPEPRPLSRFVVTTFQSASESAARWGVKNYTIEAWDAQHQSWRRVAEEQKDRIMATRVHTLKAPVTAGRFRVVVFRVASADQVARLLQVEAWGPKPGS